MTIAFPSVRNRQDVFALPCPAAALGLGASKVKLQALRRELDCPHNLSVRNQPEDKLPSLIGNVGMTANSGTISFVF
jgi:hypothetical protein